MVITLQQWFDKQYPAKTRNTIANLKVQQINDNNIQGGSLKLVGFVNLKKFDSQGSKINDLNLSLCHNLEELDCSLQRSNFNYNGYSGSGYSAPANSLRALKLDNLTKLTKINCSSNALNSLDFLLTLEPKKITHLNISNNCFGRKNENNLTFLTNFINLEELSIAQAGFNGNLDSLRNLVKLRRLDLSKNRVIGSLEPLENLEELKFLDISETDIDSGLEYLPENLEELVYVQFRQEQTNNNIYGQIQSNYFIAFPTGQVDKIIQELMPYENYKS
jgi:hypothetical protein